MRVALLSDIHGNLVALEAVLADLRSQGSFDQIVVGGDLVWAGPWPAEVVDAVRGLGAAVIQGNTDAFFRREPDETPEGKDDDRFAAHRAWMQDRLGPKRTTFLADLPFSHRVTPAAGQDLWVVHANPHDQECAIIPRMSEDALDALLSNTGTWSALAFGHVHIPFSLSWRGRLLADIASAGLPMDGDRRAVWAILAWDGARWHAEYRRVFYNVPMVVQAMKVSGLPRGKHFAERLVTARYAAFGAD